MLRRTLCVGLICGVSLVLSAAVVMKVGRHLPKLRRALERSGRLPRAIYVEHGTMADAVMMPLSAKPDDEAPYFAVVLVPGWEGRP